LNLVLIVKGFKPLRKNLDNSPKFLLDNVFMNVNLDGLTCMQKFEDIIQVANRTWFNNIQIGFDFEFKLKPKLHCRCTIELL
jgi:hypothetical protein